MADPTTIRGSKVRVELDLAGTGSYAAPCGFTSKAVTFGKDLEEVILPDCSDPDKLPWKGRDAMAIDITISGEGVLAAESQETWFDAWESPDSVAAKIEIEFPATTVTFTGLMHIGPLELGAPNLRGRATLNGTLSSDGAMVRTST